MKMKARDRARYEARASIIKAMAHPTRLFILEELKDGDRCVCELQEKIDADLSTVSKHLSVLKSAGLVSDNKKGTQIFYSLRVPCVLNFLGCVEVVLKANAKEQMALVRQ